MKFFKDAALQVPVEAVDMGVVVAGKSQMLVVYVLNESKADLVDLKFAAEGLDVQGPAILKPGESAPVVLTWTPLLTLRQPLETSLVVEGVEIYRPRR